MATIYESCSSFTKYVMMVEIPMDIPTATILLTPARFMSGYLGSLSFHVISSASFEDYWARRISELESFFQEDNTIEQKSNSRCLCHEYLSFREQTK